MTISKKLIDHLNKTKHEIIGHKKVFTAYDAAATLKVKLEQVVKVLLVKIDKKYVLALLAASQNLDFKKLAKIFKVSSNKVSIPKEKVMTQQFKVKPGAISAFGSIYKVPVVLEKSLNKVKEAIFPSGSFTESIRMKVVDFINLEQPQVMVFGAAKKFKVKSKKSKIKKKKK